MDMDVVRAGVWRRGFALVIDIIVAQVILQLIAAVAYPLSGGHVIASNSLYTACETAWRLPAGAAVPPGFNPTAYRLCTKSFFGLTTARLFVIERALQGPIATTTSLSYPVDPQGHVTKAVDIVFLQVLALVLMRWATDRFVGGSLGRRLAHCRLVWFVGSGEDRTVSRSVTRRYILFGVAAVPGLVATVLLILYGSAVGTPTSAMLTAAGALQTLPLWVAGSCALAAIRRRQDAFYDEPFGTAVAEFVHGRIEMADTPAPVEVRNATLAELVASARANAVRSWPRLTAVLIALLVAIFAAESLHPAAIPNPDGIAIPTLVLFGGADHELVVQIGQWYRLVFAVFLHASAVHLIVNALVLLVAGWLLEGLVGRAWFLAVFVIGGLGGSVASVFWNPPTLVTVGASGAIMALLAAGLVVSGRQPDGARRRWTRAFGYGVGLPTLLTSGHVAIGTIDVADHVGGAITGLILGFVMLGAWKPALPRPRFGRAALGGALALGIASLASIPFAGFADAPLSALLVPPDRLPKTDAEWEARADDLAHRYPGDPRPHLARAVVAERHDDAALRDRELGLAIAASRRIDPAHAKAFEGNAFVTVGTAAQERHDLTEALQAFGQAIAIDPANAEAYQKRAAAEGDDQRFADEIADLRRLAALRPDNGRIHVLIGDALFAQGDLDTAVTAYDTALSIAPGDAVAFRQRGWARFFDGKGAAAMPDLEDAAAHDPKDAYAALWLDIVAVRSGDADRMDALSRAIDLHVWPGAVVRFYLGEIDEKALDAEADTAPDAKTRQGQRCEADFYLGEWNIMRHSDLIARPYLSAALVSCPKDFAEWAAVRQELKGAAGYRPDTASFDAK